jgi:hypothetical protein
MITVITDKRNSCKHILRMRFRVSDPITPMHRNCQQSMSFLLSRLTTEDWRCWRSLPGSCGYQTGPRSKYSKPSSSNDPDSGDTYHGAIVQAGQALVRIHDLFEPARPRGPGTEARHLPNAEWWRCQPKKKKKE